jgi:hypothetical protein
VVFFFTSVELHQGWSQVLLCQRMSHDKFMHLDGTWLDVRIYHEDNLHKVQQYSALIGRIFMVITEYTTARLPSNALQTKSVYSRKIASTLYNES